MATRLVVSAECPTCGAPLDFSEGTNALRCSHCRSNLLVTGRKQVLSYFIAAKLDGPSALSIARFAEPSAEGPFRIGEPHLYFVPYYRFTGLEFRWEWTRIEPERDTLEFWSVGEKGSAGVDDSSIASSLPVKEEIGFQDRYIEKNFVACDLEEFGLYSLGVRPSVLRLELFRRPVLETRGTIVGADLSVDQALEHGLKAPGLENVEDRQVIARVLSLVYFPFWVAEIERNGRSSLTIIDAVSQGVVRRGAPSELRAQLNRPYAEDPPTIGFRPLACPNCGWDLPVEAEDVIFYCPTCNRAWEIVGNRFDEVTCEVAEVPGIKPETSRFLPLWVLEAETSTGPRRFFVPAFRYRRLKNLNDVAANLTRTNPSWSVSVEKRPDLRGGYLDQDDAAALARFVHAGLRLTETERIQRDPIRFGAARLTWLPFKVDSYSLCDPFTGTALSKNLLL